MGSTKSGFLKDSKLLCVYSSEINTASFKKLLNLLEGLSVVVMDDMSYHSVEINKASVCFWKYILC